MKNSLIFFLTFLPQILHGIRANFDPSFSSLSAIADQLVSLS